MLEVSVTTKSPLVGSIGAALVVVVFSGYAVLAGASEGRGQKQDDHSGFEPIFDGSTMKNWDGDPAFWKIETGALVGQSTAQNPLKENTFLIWRGGEPADFELKVEFRMDSTNSGIQFRSVHLPQGTRDGDREVAGKWVLKGYQADIDFGNTYTGQIYEERGRGFLAKRGQAVYVASDGRGPKLIGNLERTPDELKKTIKAGDWNQVHIIARGTTIIQIVNGQVTSILVDDDTRNRAMKGLLGFQMHMGPPMKIEFRNIYLKKL
jgi:hypothetical protein